MGISFITLNIVFGFLFGVVYIAGMFFSNYGNKNQEDDAKVTGRMLKIAAAGFFGLLFAATSLGGAIHTVDAGHVGVVKTFGKITGNQSAGLVLIWPWQNMEDATTQVQTLCFSKDAKTCPDGATLVGGELASFSSETQNVFIDAVLRIKVDPSDVTGLYRDVGNGYINKLIPGSIAQVFKDEMVNYKAVDVAPNRETIRVNVEALITRELSRFSIDVDALLIENISFEESFELAIQAKQDATQEALKEQELVAAKEAKARQVVAEAQGEAARLITVAAGQAEANELISKSLTPELIQFQAMQKLADNIQIALLPAGQGIIIDPTTILGGKAAAK